MRKGFLAAVLAVAASSNLLNAQELPTRVEVNYPVADAGSVEGPNVETITAMPGTTFFSYDPVPEMRLWGSAEYLLWWATRPNLPPLVTRGDLNDAFPGALNQPGTTVLFGGEQKYGAMNGLRVTLGGWLPGAQWGVEGNAFFFGSQSSNFTTTSDAQGNPPTFFPIFRPDVNREGLIRISDPVNTLLGTVNIGTSSRFWGAEANVLFKLDPINCWNIALIGGFKYLDLQEGVTFLTELSDPLFDIQRSIRESFNTRSQFYGAQLGVKLSQQWDRLSIDFTGKLALGASRHMVNIQGSDTVSGTGALPAGTFTEGIFTQTSNIGRRTDGDFAVVPQGQLKIAYDVLPWLRSTIGYDFLYWSQVVRAGEQIDHRIDVTQSQSFGTGAVATSPAPQINRSGYWAHGVAFGLAFRY